MGITLSYYTQYAKSSWRGQKIRHPDVPSLSRLSKEDSLSCADWEDLMIWNWEKSEIKTYTLSPPVANASITIAISFSKKLFQAQERTRQTRQETTKKYNIQTDKPILLSASATDYDGHTILSVNIVRTPTFWRDRWRSCVRLLRSCIGHNKPLRPNRLIGGQFQHVFLAALFDGMHNQTAVVPVASSMPCPWLVSIRVWWAFVVLGLLLISQLKSCATHRQSSHKQAFWKSFYRTYIKHCMYIQSADQPAEIMCHTHRQSSHKQAFWKVFYRT